MAKRKRTALEMAIECMETVAETCHEELPDLMSWKIDLSEK